MMTEKHHYNGNTIISAVDEGTVTLKIMGNWKGRAKKLLQVTGFEDARLYESKYYKRKDLTEITAYVDE